MKASLTRSVPHVELDPLFLDLEAGCVILKHGGDVILEGGRGARLKLDQRDRFPMNSNGFGG